MCLCVPSPSVDAAAQKRRHPHNYNFTAIMCNHTARMEALSGCGNMRWHTQVSDGSPHHGQRTSGHDLCIQGDLVLLKKSSVLQASRDVPGRGPQGSHVAQSRHCAPKQWPPLQARDAHSGWTSK